MIPEQSACQLTRKCPARGSGGIKRMSHAAFTVMLLSGGGWIESTSASKLTGWPLSECRRTCATPGPVLRRAGQGGRQPDPSDCAPRTTNEPAAVLRLLARE